MPPSKTAASSAAARTTTTTSSTAPSTGSATASPSPTTRAPPAAASPCLYYYLYGLERAGRLTARRFIGKHDWYREGAEVLVREQDSLSHYWKGNWYAERDPRISTAMALLFLSKGRRPIVMAKVKYGEGDNWNQHRRDAAHLTEYTEEAWGLGLTWQVMDPADATVEDLLQAPMLYISGSQAPNLLPHAKKLRDYVDRGGFIFAEACCSDSSRFDAAFRQLMAAVFPEPEYKLQPIAARPSDLANARHRPPRFALRRPPLRHRIRLPHLRRLLRPRSLVLLGTRPPRPMELATRRQSPSTSPTPWRSASTSSPTPPTANPKAKNKPSTPRDGESASADGSPAASSKSPSSATAAAATTPPAPAQPAPHRLPRRTETPSPRRPRTDQHHRPQPVSATTWSSCTAARISASPTPNGTQLREYLERGGTLLADSICASKPFTDCLPPRTGRRVPRQTAPSAFPPTDPIFTTAYGGYDIRHVSLRDPQAADDGQQPVAARVRQVEPQLEGIQLDGRWAVIFSPFDISCALESHEGIGCRGYTQQDAARIGLNVLLYSLNQ